MAKQPIQLPGAPDSAPSASDSTLALQEDEDTIGGIKVKDMTDAADPRDAEIERLKAELAQARADIDPKKLVVTEPTTPHGAEAIASSAFYSMTSKQLQAKIAAGEMTAPKQSVLCRDGYFVPPSA